MANQNGIQGDSSDLSATLAQDTRSGYCQECGRALTPATLRHVGHGIFCVSCATHQAASNPGWQQVHAASYRAVPPSGSPAGAPNPVLAALLGFIPGVGAMYNAQYAKGVMHLVVFVVLLALSDNLSWVFYWFVWGWVFYQVFDAYHTARARRDRQPLPNPFGWNDLAERFGLQKEAPLPYTPPEASPRATAAGVPPAWPGYNPPPPKPFREADTREASENPYTAPFPPFSAEAPAEARHRPATSVPYEPIYVGPSLVPSPTPTRPYRRFPVSAIWLIGIGLVFLFGNLLPNLRVSGQWFAPILLAAVGLWSGFRRWEAMRSAQMTGGPIQPLAAAVMGPVLMLSLALLLSLQFASVVSLRRTWPVLLIVSGGLSLLQRLTAVPPSAAYPQPVAQNAPAPPPVRTTSGTGSYGL